MILSQSAHLAVLGNSNSLRVAGVTSDHLMAMDDQDAGCCPTVLCRWYRRNH